MEINRELIQRARTGDQDAITRLYESTYSTIYKTVRALIRDEDMALDIVQDSYLKGFQSLDQLDTPEYYQAWMKRIATNRAKDYLKKKRLVLFSELADDENEELSFVDEHIDHSPDQVLDQKETTRLMNEILDSLSDEQRLVIGMYYYEELSVREIAEIIGCSENTVKSRLNYGRKKVEGKVRDLEKKGTKLYSLAPIPFLLLLFHQDAMAAEIPSGEILQEVLRQLYTSPAGNPAAGNSGAVQAGTSAASAAKTAAGSASGGLGAKIAAGVLIAAIIGGGAAAGITYVVSRSRTAAQEAAMEPTSEESETIVTEAEVVEEDTPVEVITPEVQEEEPAVNDHSIYDSIISDFRQNVQNQESPSDGLGNAYGFIDLNADGQDELLIADTYTDENGNLQTYTVCGIYTAIDGSPVQVAEGWSRNRYLIYENGYILNSGSSGADSETEAVYLLSASGDLMEAGVSPDSLTTLQYISYTLVEQENSTEASGEISDDTSSSMSFEEILARIEEAGSVSTTEYEADPGYYSTLYSDLGVGIIDMLVYKEQGAYTLDFFYREYDIDQDGENELLIARGTSPSYPEPIAVYDPGASPMAVVGQGLAAFAFPDNVVDGIPQWNLIF